MLLGFLGVVHALSTSGTQLLVVSEDKAEQDLYSIFWKDLKGVVFRICFDKHECQAKFWLARGYSISFESPKNEKLSLFQHGDRAYDHLIILPPKSKGPPFSNSIVMLCARNAIDHSCRSWPVIDTEVAS